MFDLFSTKRRPGLSNVRSDLLKNNRQIKPQQIRTEKQLEILISGYLSADCGYEDVHQQYNIQGYLGLKIDIDLGDGAFGIEIKKTPQILKSASEAQRLLGQVVYYTNSLYTNENLIVLMVGTEQQNGMPLIKELRRIINELGATTVLLDTHSRTTKA